MKYAGAFALAILLTGCGDFFEEMPLGEGSTTQGTQSGSGSGATSSDSTGLDCKVALSDCASQEVLVECQGEPRAAQSKACAQTCGAMTPVTCYAAADFSSHGCWCEQSGPVNQFGCAGISQCVARCGGPEQGSTCVRSCFSRNSAVAARLYGALVYCAQTDCKELCRNNPAQCSSCVQRTMAGSMGACVALSSACAQDRGEQGGIVNGV